ncbi:hypothetical protein GCM10009765_33100 [Fodinicola feengrottensis]|uniref:Uncharacterized protein n=1 Tax=Fodinicola feengrottensis TaxID=435914 RepID=A0ABN2H3E4_9ACTN
MPVLHSSLSWPSQSTAMLDDQKKAPVAPQIGTRPPICGLTYVPFDTCRQLFVLASKEEALG